MSRWANFSQEELEKIRDSFIVYGDKIENRIFNEVVAELERRE